MTLPQLGLIVGLSIGIGVLLAQLVAMRPTKPGSGKHAASSARPAWPEADPDDKGHGKHRLVEASADVTAKLRRVEAEPPLAAPVRPYMRRRQA